MLRPTVKKVEDSEESSKVEPIDDDPVASIDYVPVYKSSIYVTSQELKAPINMLSRSKAPKNTVSWPRNTVV